MADVRSDVLRQVIDEATKLGLDPYAQGAGENSDSELWSGDFEVGYRGGGREVGYPGTGTSVIEFEATPNETATLATGPLVDYSTREGTHGAAALIAAHRLAERPADSQVRKLARAIDDAVEEDGGSEFFLSVEAVDEALGV